MSRSPEYEETTAGQQNAGLAASFQHTDSAAAQVNATLAVYEVLAVIASELTYMRKLWQENQR